VRQALDYAVHAHGDKKRASGEPAYYHDISVAEILLDLNMDLPSILAGLLHDTIEERTSGFHTAPRSATPKEQGDHPNPRDHLKNKASGKVDRVSKDYDAQTISSLLAEPDPQIQGLFGLEAATIVAGVNRLSSVRAKNRSVHAAETNVAKCSLR